MNTNVKLGLSLALALAVGWGCGDEAVGPLDVEAGGGGEVPVANGGGSPEGEQAPPDTSDGEPALQREDGAGPMVSGPVPGIGGGTGENPGGPLVAHLRLRGDNPGAATFFGLEVAEVQVVANGAVLGTVLAPEAGLDLAFTSHAWLLWAFELPPLADTVDFRVRFADTATLETAEGSHRVDAQSAPVTFTATRAQLAQRGHAVIHLDIDESLVSTPDGLVLLPRLTVRF